jgi:hypothetical protein
MEVAHAGQTDRQLPEVNWYHSFNQPQVVSTISVYSWLEKIKDSTHKERIIKARIGELDYDNTKESLPCVTFNFLFNRYKNNNNILTATGLMYIDIDKEDFEIDLVDKSKIFAHFRSFGGEGHAILVRVENLTLDNFKATYSSVSKELGISEFVDVSARKATQYNVLTYDPNIFINADSHVFSATNVAPQSVVIGGTRKQAYTIDGGAKHPLSTIRYDNLDSINLTTDYMVNWDGYDYIKCFIPMKKVMVNRNNFLLSYCNNLVYLNPWISAERTIQLLDNVNQFACAVPVDEGQIRRVVSSIFRYQQEGKLSPIYFNKRRKIVFDKKSKLTREEKLEICRIELAMKRTSDSRQKMYNLLEGWNFDEHGKITQRKLYMNCPISKKTVEKYWHEFKDFVNTLNQSAMKKETIEVSMNDLPNAPALRKAMEKLQSKIIDMREEMTDGQELVFQLVWAA